LGLKINTCIQQGIKSDSDCPDPIGTSVLTYRCLGFSLILWIKTLTKPVYLVLNIDLYKPLCVFILKG